MAWERVCPKCGGAFRRMILGLNLLTYRLERCPHCGKWSLFKAFSGESVAEAKLRKDMTEPAESEEERLRRRIEESRYE